LTLQSVRTLLEQACDPAFIVDPSEDRFIAINDAMCAMLGYTHEHLLVTPVSHVHRSELPQLLDFLDEVLRNGYGSTVALTCRMKSGKCLPTEMSLHAFDNKGRVYVLGLVYDRSEHRHIPTELTLSPCTVHTATLRLTEPPKRRSTPMVRTGLIVRLEANAGKEEEVASFLRDALPLVQAEPATIAWFALRIGGSSFAIVDAFPDEDGRRAHLDGAVAAALIEGASELLVRPPEIEHVDVLAAKLP
jgi:PAS domain S-box-containing protein